MRILKTLLIAATVMLPAASFAQTVAVERTHVRAHSAGYAVGIPGIANPGSLSWIVPLRTGDVNQAASAGTGEGGAG